MYVNKNIIIFWNLPLYRISALYIKYC